MGHLLYSSNEMYSSTDLIRKSKTIFNKIISKEIDKAIILRDGKPSFMLLDFDKYEKIMAEYDELKANLDTNKNTTSSTYKIKKDIVEKLPKEIASKSEPIEKVEKEDKQSLNVEDKIIVPQIKKIQPSHVVPPTPKYTKEDEEEIVEDDKIVEVYEPVIKIEEESKESEEDKSEKEVQEGLEVLEDLDFDDEFKKEVERKVRERQVQIQAVKKIKEEKLALEKLQEEQEENEEYIFDDEIDEEEEKREKEKAKKKKTELKEFWA